MQKELTKLKQANKTKAKELLRVKGELNVQKVQNEEYRGKIEEMVRQRQNLNTSNVQQAYQGRPSTSHYSATMLGKENAESGHKDSEKVRELN